MDKEKNKCQMKLTDQFIEKVVSKRSKKARLSRNNSLVRQLIISNSYLYVLFRMVQLLVMMIIILIKN